MVTQHELNKLMALRHIHRTRTYKKRHLIASNLQPEYIEPILRELKRQGLIQINRNTARITPFGKAYLKKADGVIVNMPENKFRFKFKKLRKLTVSINTCFALLPKICAMLIGKMDAITVGNHAPVKQLSSKFKEFLLAIFPFKES